MLVLGFPLTPVTILLLSIFLHIIMLPFCLSGIYQSFKKAWYLGITALLVPGFATVLGLAKLLFKKDLLK